MSEEFSELAQKVCEVIALEHTTWHWSPLLLLILAVCELAGVESTKFRSKKVIAESILTFSELSTWLCRIEACLNSRPLLPLTDDPSGTEFLSLLHFLIWRSSFLVPEISCLNDKIAICQRWRFLSQKVQDFCQRWKNKYLPTLQPRQKWLYKTRSFQIGDIVYIKNEDTPPAKWPLGKIVQTNLSNMFSSWGVVTYRVFRLCNYACTRIYIYLYLTVNEFLSLTFFDLICSDHIVYSKNFAEKKICRNFWKTCTGTRVSIYWLIW